MKLGLGTVQFGLDYGIANPAGKTPQSEVRDILELAANSGIHILDTASAYGVSEDTIGQCLSGPHSFRIVTKTPVFRANTVSNAHVTQLLTVFHESLRKLRQPKVYGLLAHSAKDVLAPGGENLVRAMLDLKQQGLVDRVGVSVYTGAEVDGILDRFPIDLVQLPISVFDQRMIKGGQLSRLHSKGVEIHARSVFLQGLLLMQPESVPAHFAPIRGHLDSYHGFLRDSGLSPLRAALDFVLGLDELDHVILGINNTLQLEQVLAETTKPVAPRDLSRFALTAENMLDPSRWRIDGK